MEKRTNKGLIVLIVILIILVIALMGFIAYKEFYLSNTAGNKITTTNKEVKNDNLITNIEDFPEENDNNLKTYELSNYIIYDDEPSDCLCFSKQNIGHTFEIENIEFELVASQQETNEIMELDLYANDKLIKTIDAYQHGYSIIITNKYIILQHGAAFIYPGNIDIFDKSGNLLKSVVNTNKSYTLNIENDKESDTTMKIVDNKLYYITSTDLDVNLYDIKFKYIDLENLNEYTIQEFQGFTNQQE